MKQPLTPKTKAAAFVLSTFLLGWIWPMTAYADSESPAVLNAWQNIAVDETNFPDASFRQYVAARFDSDSDSLLSQKEISAAVQIDLEWDDTVTTLQGIELLTNLEQLNCAGTSISVLDVTHNLNLKELNCTYTGLESLNVSQNKALEKLECYETQISSLNVTQNTNLIRLDCNNTPIAALDVTHNPELFALNCEDTNISELNISQNPKLYEVYITNTPVETMDYSHNPELVHIRISGTKMTSLDVSHNPKLAALYCSNTLLTGLDLSGNPEMFEIFCYDSNIEKLDVSAFTGLRTLDCHNTKISELNIANNINLVGLNCSGTKVSSLNVNNNTLLQRLEYANTEISNLDLSANSQLRYLDCSNTTMETLDFSGYTNLEEVYCEKANVKTLKVPGTVYGLNCSGNALTELDLSSAGNMWLECTLSPQNRTVYFKAEGQILTLDMSTIVSDVSKVGIVENGDYTYDDSTGLITITNPETAAVTYRYSHGYADAAPLDVTLQIQKQYNILDGHNQTVAEGKDLVIRSDAAVETFVKLLVDGVEVPRQFYTVSEGSTVITLKSEYLKTLPAGTHTITFLYSDGISETTFIVPEKILGETTVTPTPDHTGGTAPTHNNGSKAPQTGDLSNTILYLLLSVSAAMTIVINIRKNKTI